MNNSHVTGISKEMDSNQKSLKELFEVLENRSVEAKSRSSESSIGINEISKESIKISDYAEEMASVIEALSIVTNKFILYC